VRLRGTSSGKGAKKQMGSGPEYQGEYSRFSKEPKTNSRERGKRSFKKRKKKMASGREKVLERTMNKVLYGKGIGKKERGSVRRRITIWSDGYKR